jgi:hypothetical protein
LKVELRLGKKVKLGVNGAGAERRHCHLASGLSNGQGPVRRHDPTVLADKIAIHQ